MLRQHFEQRDSILRAVEKIMVEKLHGIDAELPGQIAQVPVQPISRGEGGFTAKHGRDTAEGAAKTAAQRRLIARGAPAEEGPGEIIAWISGPLVRQGAFETGGGK